jgi:hypothetical protein
MVIQELRDVVHLVVQDDPTVGFRVVPFHVFPGEGLRARHVPQQKHGAKTRSKNTEFLLDNHCELWAPRRSIPYFKQGPDMPKLNAFVGVFRATDVNGKHFEVTNG